MRTLDFVSGPIYNKGIMGNQTDQVETGTVLTRIELLKTLQAAVPINVYGIPEGVYRPDLLPDSYEVETEPEQGGDHVLATPVKETNTDNPVTDVPTKETGDGPIHKDAIRVGGVDEDQSVTDGLQLETGEGATASHGDHPKVLELAGIIDARQSILERLPEDQPLVEVKAKLDGSDADPITAFAGSFASRSESPRPTEVTDVPPVDLPEDSEVTRTSAPSGVPEVVDPISANGRHFQRVGVDLVQFRHAFVPIIHAEGFPAFPDGRPIWLRTDYESEDTHRLFEQYLLMGQAGVRQLFLLQDIGPYSLPELQDFFILYSWAPRLKAYDIFRVAEFRKIQANRAIEIEDDHFLKAQRLFDRAMVYMESEDFLGALTPKVALDLMKTVVQIQRMSTGLPPNGVRQDGEGGQIAIEASLRTFNADGSDAVSGSSPNIVGSRENGSAVHGEILADPKSTHLAQELVLRMITPKPKSLGT